MRAIRCLLPRIMLHSATTHRPRLRMNPMNPMKKTISLLVLLSGISLSASQTSRARSIDRFFADFTAEWMRENPNGATAARYFAGEEENRLERQLTPETVEYRRERINLAGKGLEQLRIFDRNRL